MAILNLPDTDTAPNSVETPITFPDNRLLIDLCGVLDANIAKIAAATNVQITHRGNQLFVQGDALARKHAQTALQAIYARLQQGKPLETGDIDAAIRMSFQMFDESLVDDQIEMFRSDQIEIRTRKRNVEPRTPGQKTYVKSLFQHELIFGLGPAGTGKTYLAVAAAVANLIEGRIDRIILTRPAVEAGERLGFLPGDMKEKVDPYMQPLYDALNDFLPAKQVIRMLEEKQIEIAPLAFMRGRTLANAFVILDEAQNTTTMQMKMFLTRLGEGSRIVVTGDTSQIDLPRGALSGLVEAERVLRNVKGIGFTRFTSKDVVRHPMVARIIDAYDAAGKPDA
ncbi:MAG: PhoH family protein [Paracoccaceae bacterium]